MENECTARAVLAEMQDEDILLWHSLVHKLRNAPESELLVVCRVAYQCAAVGSHIAEQRESLVHKGLADALSLVFRRYGDGAQPVPVSGLVRDCDCRERRMSDHFPVDLGYERYGERVGLSQRRDDIRLGLLTVGMILEGRPCDLRNGVDIRSLLMSDYHVLMLSLLRNTHHSPTGLSGTQYPAGHDLVVFGSCRLPRHDVDIIHHWQIHRAPCPDFHRARAALLPLDVPSSVVDVRQPLL